MMSRRLGRSNITVSPLGLGTNGLGGPIRDATRPEAGLLGYGHVDEATAMRTIQAALDSGVTFFDTADEYGCGRAERLLGKALAGKREQAVIATKFGTTFDEQSRTITGQDARPAAIRRACEASLRRLQADVIDLYLLHLRDLPLEEGAEVRETLEDLVSAGKIRWYGWSTDDVERARFFAAGAHCTAVEHRLNIFLDAPEMLALCADADLASINRIPLLMGILTGKYRGRQPQLPAEDARSRWFAPPPVLDDVRLVEQLRGILTEDGRSVVQGTLGWIWARSPHTIPIPGSKTAVQAAENGAAMQFGPLRGSQMGRIAQLMAAGRPQERSKS